MVTENMTAATRNALRKCLAAFFEIESKREFKAGHVVDGLLLMLLASAFQSTEPC